MLFNWFRSRRRRTLLQQPFPLDWGDVLRTNVRTYHRLALEEQARVRDYAQVFVAEKHWEGCGGQQIDDEVRVTIAAQVAILVLGLGAEYFDRVLSVLVYPNAYAAPGRTISGTGTVVEGQSNRQGEAWYRGPVILSWSDVLAGARQEAHGHNLVYHEFAHQLDMLNGRTTDGIPPMATAEQAERWARVVGDHYRQLVDDCEQGRATLLGSYAATSTAEFFAVATETFFERPSAMRHGHPDLYACFRDYYRQDPIVRESAAY
jgi:hypothetical protein